MQSAIEVKDIGKRYYLGQNHTGSIRDSIGQLFGKVTDHEEKNEFWALKDISFEVKKGEILGIVGKNGAGKSTLLKILSRITYPTTGSIKYSGRLASLLEVGTGFHPELTGRENVFLNGTLMGMTHQEVRNKFDEIIDFSGIEQFIDTPVKHYSSGMYVRLAFSVAAHLEPEILIIDEVLAVGDVDFQKKCLGKMDQVSKHDGRTVIFVSHNMSAVNNLCTSGILLENGKIGALDSIEEITKLYLSGGTEEISASVDYTQSGGKGDNYARVLRVQVIDKENAISDFYKIEQPVFLEVTYEVIDPVCNPMASFHIYTSNGEKIFVSIDTNNQERKLPGIYKSVCKIPGNFFNGGNYIVGLSLSTISPLINHYIQYTLLTIRILDNPESITRGNYNGNFSGAIRPLFNWETVKQ